MPAQEQALTARYRMGNYVDTFAPGHYARVLEAEDVLAERPVAFKVMRPEHLAEDGTPQWEARAFVNEADLLMRLADCPVAVRLYDCGFVATRTERPAEGAILALGQDVAAFREQLYPYSARGWRPYLALELLPRRHNLFYVMKPNHAQGRRRLPTEEGLDVAAQFAHFLQEAHARHVVYLDHKLEHIYWDGQRLRVIDFNSSQLVERGTHTVEQHVAKDVHNLCVGVLYPVFTGLSPQKGALRPQPASREEVARRYADVEALDFGPEPTLSAALQALLQRGARQELSTMDEFLEGLRHVAARYGWEAEGLPTVPALREARRRTREGLQAIRAGQEALRHARELLMEAAILDEINEDVEAELRRLLSRISDALNHRVIP